MRYYFTNTAKAYPKVGDEPAPISEAEQQQLIDSLQDFKTKHYQQLLAQEAHARPGVLSLMDEALKDPTVAVGVCSAATKEAAQKTLEVTLGPERVEQLDVCLLGDDVSAKKPDPLIYQTAAKRLSVPVENCVVVEDSLIGLQAAKGANMKCIITYTSSTADQDFSGAQAKVPNLASVTLESIFGPLRREGKDANLLVGVKD